jgi:hypothetical protein
MQDRPDASTLLEAVARFLGEEVRPAVSDPALSFRVLIAASLSATVARELATTEEQDQAQLERLRALLPDVAPPGLTSERRAERHAAIATMEDELAARIRDDRLTDGQLLAAHAHVERTLAEKLAVTNPRFDLRPEIG